MQKHNIKKYSFMAALVVIFTACGGRGSGTSSNAGTQNNTGTQSNAGQVGQLQVKKTGRTKSYGRHNIEATDGSIKDDGLYQSGVTPSYIRDDSAGIVTDKVTGLQWVDSEKNVVSKRWITKESFYKKRYTDTSGDTAMNYCPNLSLGGYSDWRLPTVRELASMMSYSRTSKTIINDVFKYGNDQDHWTATIIPEEMSKSIGGRLSSAAWRIWTIRGDGVSRASSGTQYYNHKAIGYLVRCVRNSVAPANFSKSEDIVTDNITKLQWQDDASISPFQGDLDWFEAIEYCEGLALGGHADWRLPNINELTSIADLTRFPAIDKVFTHVGKKNRLKRWSSSASNGSAKLLDFQYGNYSMPSKSVSSQVRCVRAGL